MEDFNLFYESQGIKNYLCTKVAEPLSKYQIKMLECNQIAGILPVHGTTMNGICKLHYDITKMQRLSDVLRNKIDGKQAKKLLLDILNAILITEDYFLSFTRCFLHPDYVFLQSDNKVGLVYLPYKEKELTSVDTIHQFYQTLLVDYLTEDNDVFFLMLLKYVNKQDFSIAGLMEKLEDAVDKKEEQQQKVLFEPDENNYVSQKEWSATKEDSFIDKEELEAKSEIKTAKKPLFDFSPKKEKAESSSEVVELGFQVPRMESMPVAVPKQKEEKEKKGGLFGGRLFAGKKASEETKPEKKQVSFLKPSPKQEPQVEIKQNQKGHWSGTVLLEEESTKTELLGMEQLPCLVHKGSKVELNTYPFRIGNGKVSGMNYVIPNGAVSKNHASIQYSNGKYYIKDENSANHTYVNGKQIPPYTEIELSSGDVVRLANEEMIFQI